MKFRTEIEVNKVESKIDYASRIFTIGSCFAENIAGSLAAAKFRTTTNPMGVMFNPLSILDTLDRLHSARVVTEDDLSQSGGMHFSYDFHGSFSESDPMAALSRMNAAIESAHTALDNADWVIITLGTAWVYEVVATGKVAANCHKQPSATFRRRRLSVDEVVQALGEMVEKHLSGKNIILTISPVRHLGDGLQDNFLSKATLKIAVAQSVERYASVHYFPAYEILTDDLRDYRYYADDLVHPSTQAVEYVWERFAESYFAPHTIQIMEHVGQITAAAAHRPFDPRSYAYTAFCRKQLELITRLPQIDLSAEKEFFTQALQIN